jgi:hypothetical protein
VAPANGVPQGNFEAATFLVTPKSLQVVSTGFTWQVDNKTLLKTEFAFSNYDVNTFSEKIKEMIKAMRRKLI